MGARLSISRINNSFADYPVIAAPLDASAHAAYSTIFDSSEAGSQSAGYGTDAANQTLTTASRRHQYQTANGLKDIDMIDAGEDMQSDSQGTSNVLHVMTDDVMDEETDDDDGPFHDVSYIEVSPKKKIDEAVRGTRPNEAVPCQPANATTYLAAPLDDPASASSISAAPAGIRGRRAKDFVKFPHEGHKSKQMFDLQKEYEKLIIQAPRDELPERRYWIAVVAEGSKTLSHSALSTMVWFKGNRTTTIQTVKRRYAIMAALNHHDINLLSGGILTSDNESMEDIDVLGKHFVVFHCALKTNLAPPKLTDMLLKKLSSESGVAEVSKVDGPEPFEPYAGERD